jgi:hypothetical protein
VWNRIGSSVALLRKADRAEHLADGSSVVDDHESRKHKKGRERS